MVVQLHYVHGSTAVGGVAGPKAVHHASNRNAGYDLIELGADGLAWKLRGSCATLTLEESDRLFFSGGAPSAEAKQMCGNCPVQQKCLDYSQSAETYAGSGYNLHTKSVAEFGVWGGYSGPERAAMRREKETA